MFQHRLGVEIGDQEGDIVALEKFQHGIMKCRADRVYLYRLPPQDKERLGALCQESCELVDQNMFDLVGLLYPDADADTVDTRLNEDLLIFVAGDVQRVQQELGGAAGFDFGDIVSFRGLGGKVGDGQRSSEG